MDKETLSHYGWIVVLILVLSVMIALATPFGQYVGNAVKSTTQGLFDVQQKALSAADIEIMGQEFEDMLNGGGSGGTGIETPSKPTPTECQHTNTTTINASATYTGDIYCNDCNTTIATGTLISNPNDAYDHNAPELHPTGIDLDGNGRTIPQDGDIYEYGDYFYSYGKAYNDTLGWHVWVNTSAVSSSETSYGPILESINGKPITSINSLFQFYDSLEVAPAIPLGVTDISYAFFGCTSLATAPIIPSGVTDMIDAFYECFALTNINITKEVKGIGDYSFYGCTSLTSITFEGTMTQWNAITKGNYWNYKVPATKVICSDGTVYID